MCSTQNSVVFREECDVDVVIADLELPGIRTGAAAARRGAADGAVLLQFPDVGLRVFLLGQWINPGCRPLVNIFNNPLLLS